jgi:hypothetical protein
MDIKSTECKHGPKRVHFNSHCVELYSEPIDIQYKPRRNMEEFLIKETIISASFELLSFVVTECISYSIPKWAQVQLLNRSQTF